MPQGRQDPVLRVKRKAANSYRDPSARICRRPAADAVHANYDGPSADRRPLRLVVPFSAGGSVDPLARLVGARLSPYLRTPVVIDNRPDASGCVGAESAFHDATDGIQLFCGAAGTHGTNPAICSRPGSDPLENSKPVVGVASSSNVLVTTPGLGLGSLPDEACDRTELVLKKLRSINSYTRLYFAIGACRYDGVQGARPRGV